ncbi:MAG TPA: rhamnulokinase family protein [Candidatus Acidoferrum sp.]|nr:rhamnulokinase family protein [Candidatus Acidoferrum sp.]
MRASANQKALVAVDLGAQSCRVSLLRWNGSEPEIEIIHRFSNAPVSANNGLQWDIDTILDGVMFGLRSCAAHAPEGIASVAIDGWAVDYVRLDEGGNPVAPPFCYRDARTKEAEKEVHALLSPSRLYSLTGIQILRLNTLYQLYADKLAGFDPRLPWVNLPEFIAYRLCGRRVSEYTDATHTGLVELGTQRWCDEIFQELGLEMTAVPEIVPSGSVLGPISTALASLSSLRETQIIVPACHDTASAVAAIPAVGYDWAFISSGTWSLVGLVLDTPCVSDNARSLNFTNLGGVGGRICFLKNVNGMWLLRQCMDEWEQQGVRWTLEDILSGCFSLPAPAVLIDVDDPQLMIPGNTIDKINSQLERLDQPRLGLDGSEPLAIANIIFHSMAARYAEVLARIEEITGKKLKRLFIVGGGSQNSVLNRITAERTGLEVILGSKESATIGNFAVQLATFENDWSPSTGVTANSVAKWAEQISANSLAQFSDR